MRNKVKFLLKYRITCLNDEGALNIHLMRVNEHFSSSLDLNGSRSNLYHQIMKLFAMNKKEKHRDLRNHCYHSPKRFWRERERTRLEKQRGFE